MNSAVRAIIGIIHLVNSIGVVRNMALVHTLATLHQDRLVEGIIWRGHDFLQGIPSIIEKLLRLCSGAPEMHRRRAHNVLATKEVCLLLGRARGRKNNCNWAGGSNCCGAKNSSYFS